MPNHSDDLRSILADATAQIAHYQSRIDELMAKRERARLELDSLVYPVLTLPPEITSEIFFQCLPPPEHWNSPDPQKAPMLLTRVCRRWRKIALSTPILWANIELAPGSPQPRCRDVHVLETWVSRAGALPLSIVFDFRNVDQRAATTIFKTLVRQSRRIRSLDLCGNLRDLERASFSWSFPLLQSLELYDTHRPLKTEASIGIFTDSPRLREVTLSEGPASAISLPWQQLTKFTGYLWSVADCLELWRLVPNLRECTFVNCEERDESPGLLNLDLPVLSHSILQTLTIREDEPYISALEMLKFLSLTALQTFVLDIEESVDEFDGIFHAFLLRSSLPLRTFHIQLGEFADFDIGPLFHTPKLVDLEIFNPSIHLISDFFDSLARDDAAFLPQLQHLAFLQCQIDMLHLLHRGLSARWDVRHQTKVARLESVRIEFSASGSDLPEDSLLPFQKLVANGLNLCIQKRNDIGDHITVVGQ